MPRDTRSRRTSVQAPLPAGPSVGFQPLRQEAGRVNSAAPLQGVSQLNASLSQFFNTGASVVRAVGQDLHRERLQAIERENKLQAMRGQADAISGKDADPDLVSDLDYYDAFRITSAAKSANETITELDILAAEWTPEHGDFEGYLKAHIEETYGDGTGDEVYDATYAKRVYEHVESLVRENSLKEHERAMKLAQRNATQLAVQAGARGDFTGEQYMQLFELTRAAHPGMSRGEVSALVISAMASGASTGGAGPIARFINFIHNEDIDGSGRTFAQLFPDQAAKLSIELNNYHRNAVTVEAQGHLEALSDEMKVLPSLIKSNPAQAIEHLKTLMLRSEALSNRYGAAAAFDQLQGQMDRLFESAVTELQAQYGTRSTFQGDIVIGLTQEQFNERALPMLMQSYGNPFAPDVTPEDRDRITTQWAAAVATAANSKDIPPNLRALVRDGLRGGADSAKQRGALQILQKLDAISPDLVSRVIGNDAGARFIYDSLARSDMTGTLEGELQRLNEMPRLFERAAMITDEDMRSALGIKEDVDVLDAILTGSSRGLDSWFSTSLMERLEDLGVVDDAKNAFLGPEAQQYVLQAAKLAIANARAEGRSNISLSDLQTDIANQLKGALGADLLEPASRSWGRWLIDHSPIGWADFMTETVYGFSPLDAVLGTPGRRTRLDFKKVIDNHGGGFDDPAPLGTAVENPAGIIENTQQTLLDDLNAIEDQFGIPMRITQGGRTGVPGYYDLEWINPETGLPEDAMIPFGSDYQIDKGSRYAWLGRRILDRVTGKGQFRLNLTGNIEEDEATIQAAKDLGYLPDSVSFIPIPEIGAYRLVISPRFRNKPESWVDDDELERLIEE